MSIILTENQRRAEPHFARVWQQMVGYLLHNHPFFATFAAHLPVEFTTSVPLAATDSKKIYYNPKEYYDFMEGEYMQFAFGHGHETLHVVKNDINRLRYWQRAGMVAELPFDEEIMQHSMDYDINAQLVNYSVGRKPTDVMYDPSVTTGEKNLIDIYRQQWKYKKRGGSPWPTVHGHKGFDTHLPPPPGGNSVVDDQQRKHRISQAINAEKQAGVGAGQGIGREFQKLIEAQVDYKNRVRNQFHKIAGRDRLDWSKIDRRMFALGRVSPGRKSYGLKKVVSVFDTSASMSDVEINVSLSEQKQVFADLMPEDFYFIACDYEVQCCEKVDLATEDLKALGEKYLRHGGGTSFRHPFEYINKHQLNPDVVLYYTDMEGGFPDAPPPYEVIWLATTNHVAPWGTTIKLTLPTQ